MSSTIRTLIAAGFASAALGLAAAPGEAQTTRQGCVSPPGMNYMICNGQRVPKPDRQERLADGSVREESRAGNCVTIRERRPDGSILTRNECGAAQPQ